MALMSNRSVLRRAVILFVHPRKLGLKPIIPCFGFLRKTRQQAFGFALVVGARGRVTRSGQGASRSRISALSILKVARWLLYATSIQWDNGQVALPIPLTCASREITSAEEWRVSTHDSFGGLISIVRSPHGYAAAARTLQHQVPRFTGRLDFDEPLASEYGHFAKGKNQPPGLIIHCYSSIVYI